jgi:acyl-CoA synthetase (AMP-forming)/AMP-acid ligase II
LDDNGNETNSISFEELDKRAKKLASFLHQHIQQQTEGATVMLMFPTSIEFIVAIVACAYAGIACSALHHAFFSISTLTTHIS